MPDFVAVEFPVARPVGSREWGDEILLALSPRQYSMKLLRIRAGKGGGLQYHRHKDEADYIVSGTLLVRFQGSDGLLTQRILGPGECVRFPTGAIHQTEAITDVVIIEVSTPHFNDRVRVEDRFGLPTGGGLPSTKPEEVQLW